MSHSSDVEIYNSRVLSAPIEKVYQAFANPAYLKLWWGPEGFSNTIHEFDLQAGGKWLLTMHGPDQSNYENASIFKSVLPHQLISWTRTTAPLFDMDIGFEKIDENTTKFSFKMIFKSQKECEALKNYVLPKNEENFDRLEKLLATL